MVHDLGMVLSRGQIIEHTFTLLNPSDHPLQVRSARAMSPCCSEVVAAPTSIGPGESGRLVVCFKTGYQAGKKSLGFRLEVDDPRQPSRTYALQAELVPEVEVRTLGGGDDSPRIGEMGVRTMRIITRRLREEGRGAPATFEGPTGRFVADAVEKAHEGGLIESSRDLAVELPRRDRAGPQSETLTFGWADGTSWEHRISWMVRPHLVVSPEALVISPGTAVDRTVLLKSTTTPFRVLGVEGEAVALASTGGDAPSKVQSARLRIDCRGDAERPV